MTNAAASPSVEHQQAPLVGPFGRKAVRIGRILNIEIGFDFSWLFIFALVTIALEGQFGSEHAHWSALWTWGAGLAASLIFFVSILLHELGHSVTSSALGLPVRSITLFIFGGLARLSGQPKTPRDEFLIGVAGPVVSVLLGGAYLGIAAIVPDTSAPGEITSAVFSWLGYVNLVLAGFNLFPGYPLDGGHLLRAAVWSITGKEHLATRVASLLGSTFALFLIGMGAFNVLALGNIGGFWLLLIGWFLMQASRGSMLQEILEERLGGIQARDAMAATCPTVSADATVQELIEGPILQKGERHFCVEAGTDFVGLITLHEVKSVSPAARNTTPIQSIMIPRERLATIAGDDTLWTAMKRMDELAVHQLPVISGSSGRLLGILTREQLLGVVRNQMALKAD